MQNRNDLTPQQMAYLEVLVLRTKTLTPLEYAAFLKRLDDETLDRFIALCEQWQKQKQEQIRMESKRKRMQEKRRLELWEKRRENIRKHKRKPAPTRCTIAQAWKKRQDERLAVWTKRRLASGKKKLPATIEIDNSCINGSTSTNRHNRHSAVMPENVKNELSRYYRNQN